MDLMPISKILNKFGRVRHKGRVFYVYTSSITKTDRERDLNNINNNLRFYKSKICYDNPRLSSIGYISLLTFKVCVKPIKYQGNNSFGIKNEYKLVKKLNKYIKMYKKVNILFFDGTDIKYYKDITSCQKIKHNENADLCLIDKDNHKFDISVKQSNAEKLSSCDRTMGKNCFKLINKCLSNNIIKLVHLKHKNNKIYIKNKPLMKLNNEIYFNIKKKKLNELIFNKIDMIVEQSFSDDHFLNNENNIYISCNNIYNNLNMFIKKQGNPVCLIRNDKSRNSKDLGICGLRSEICYPKRIRKKSIKVSHV